MNNQSEKVKKKSRLAKYRNITVSIVLFLLFDAAILAFNYYMSLQISKDTTALNLAARQSILTQQIAKDVMNIDLLVNNAPAASDQAASEDNSTPVVGQRMLLNTDEVQSALKSIKISKTTFEESLNTFVQKQHEIQDSNGNTMAVAIISTPEGEKTITNISDIWTPYARLIESFLQSSEQGDINADAIRYTVDYIRIFNDNLYFETNDLVFILENEVQKKTQTVQWAQGIGIAIAIILFLYIVLLALKQLLKTDEQLDIAHTEMSEIMASVNEGLFLVNRDLQIGNQYSKQLEQIIGQRNLGGKNLLSVLSAFRPQEELDTLKVFIDQLYNEWVVEDLIEDLNPLHRIAVPNPDGNGMKYLDFKFFRVFLGDKIERVLVSVSDTTESVLLQKNLENEREQENRELEILNTILGTNSTVLSNFINDSDKRLQEINQVLKSQSDNQTELHGKVQHIARLIHSIKGEASSIKLKNIVSTCEEFETSLNQMKRSHYLSGQDFLALIVLLEDLFRMFDVLKNYNLRLAEMSGMSQVPISGGNNEYQAQQAYLKQFVHDIAQRVGKQADLVISGLQEVKLNDAQQSRIKDIAIQLLRNAVVHGIELPDVRRQRNKSIRGLLRLSLTDEGNGRILFEAEDDGNGIDFEAIRKQAVNNGLVPAAEAADLDKRQLLNLMFSSGFSTAAESTEDAGKGVGMDIIKTTVQELGGKLNVSTRPESYTRFSFSFPKN